MIRRVRPRLLVWCFALVSLAWALDARAQTEWDASSPNNPYAGLVQPSNGPFPTSNGPYPTTGAAPVVTEWQTDCSYPTTGAPPVDPNMAPTSASWIVPGSPPPGYSPQPGYVDAHVYGGGDPYTQQMIAPDEQPWFVQVLPVGIIYHSYWAGVHEPRMGIQLMRITNTGNSYWDPTVGARVGLLRYGNDDPMHPQGWQLDVEGAALPRLTLDDMRDLHTVDFRGGVPLTYGVDNWQFKLAYYHLSSHLGDEFAINNPGSLDDRINYVRDAMVLGASYYAVPSLRLYAEVGYSFNATDGAEPWEIQFGTEYSQPGPTDRYGTPFVALNGHLREEHNFGGDFTAEAGWLWRNRINQTLRLGAYYFNGKSSQYETFDKFEEQIGAGLWFDF
jgi:hypothetical protein